MKKEENYFVKLVGLSTFLEQQANLDTSLDDLVSMAAGILNVENCSTMLFKDEQDSGDFRLRVFAKHGYLPPTAFKEAEKINHGIAGHVAATGQPLLVDNIINSPLSTLARRPDDPNKSFISVPIVISSKVIGVLNVSNPKDGRSFDQHDLNLTSFVALLVGKSIQVIQLQNVLKSRFAQMAMTLESKETAHSVLSPITQDPAQLSKILAKSFYREMTNVGLGKDHIINAATEIISLLNESLARHRKRMQRQ
jgi:L-methionine (R)-S-oxide reductase